MTKPYITDDFFLQSKTAKILYHDYVKELPVIDYHSHLVPKEIAEDKTFRTITQVWLEYDHTKWRLMRSNGIDEYYCTGSASDEEKFMKWAETVPLLIKSPVYSWIHLELARVFGIEECLSPANAMDIYKSCNQKLKEEGFSIQRLLRKFRVEALFTTDDPVDSLEYHNAIVENGFGTHVYPTWRPDNALRIKERDFFSEYLKKLEKASGILVNSYESFLEALSVSHDYFESLGCRLSDHGIERFYSKDYSLHELRDIFRQVLAGKEINDYEVEKFRSALLFEFAQMNHEKGWIQQYHYGAVRNQNSKLLTSFGPDAGCDSIGITPSLNALSLFLDKLYRQNKLPKTIIYNLNPNDNETVISMLGNFQDGTIPGKLQWGSAWWFNDHKKGIENQLNCLANYGLLGRFIGMVTDSRNVFSMVRHEYFRRVLCNLIGADAESGIIPKDINYLGEVVRNISYFNVKKYFDL